jgi:signal transduction histidine kinase
MRERAEELGGTFRICSTPGGGLAVEVRLLFKERDQDTAYQG